MAMEILGRYHLRVHRGLHAIPAQVWKKAKGRPPPSKLADPVRFLIDFLPAEMRRVRKDGFQLGRIRYWDPVLSSVFSLGTQILVRFDPRDLSRVYVPSPSQAEYLTIPYADLRRPPITLAELERRQHIAAAGLKLRVGVVTGDDLLPLLVSLRDSPEMFSGAAMPETLLSLNAYLGAAPIAAALGAGADIVVTGRCVDSATVLAACIHEFSWSMRDWDRLSGGSLAGHIIECGAQATGGLFTDWEIVADWSNIGYPVAIVAEDGSFDIVKPPETGGLISRGTVSEQLVYEIGNPAAYLLPDVTCDWRNVKVAEIARDRVRVSGARGAPPPNTYKASATWQDGFRVGSMWTIIGDAAAGKARKVATAILSRVQHLIAAAGNAPFSETSVEVLV